MTVLGDLRARVAGVLVTLDDDWMVLDTPTDAVAPPCFMLDWGPDPGGLRRAFCAYDAQLEVLVIPGRLTTEGAYPLFESMLEAALAALEAAGLPASQWLGPGPLEIAQITYLCCRLQLRQPVPMGGTPNA